MEEIRVCRNGDLSEVMQTYRFKQNIVKCPETKEYQKVEECLQCAIRYPYYNGITYKNGAFIVLCNYEKKTLKGKITEVIKNNKIGTEFSEYGLEIFVDSIIDIIKEDRE